MRLQGKIALVTAAGQGIGRATAEAFAKEGATVIATDLKSELLEGFPGRVEKLNALEKSEIVGLINSLERVDVLFNCAGFVHHGTILDATDEQWDFAFNLNVRSMFWAMQAVLPKMIAQYENGLGGGSILNISSVASSIKGAPNRFVYGATKAAVIGMTKAVAADFTAQGIRVNAICPGTIHTPSLEDRIRAQGDLETAMAGFMARQPIGRFGTPQEVANLAVYLASDESAFTTGSTHVIDGGWST
jgi:2-keto-3-deoxy-L-fuconate dehydrogenase